MNELRQQKNVRNLIAVVADTQLGKNLYYATKEDWLKAFQSAFVQIRERIDRVAAVLILGDIMDAEESGSGATYALLRELHSLREQEIPIGLILGNHDKNPNRNGDSPKLSLRVDWCDVCALVSPHVRELRWAEPLVIPAEGPLPPIAIYGGTHQSASQLRATLEALQIPPGSTPENADVWMCLHQALEELTPHHGASEVKAAQVPPWVRRVWLGDFHDFSQHMDGLGRPFVYPGSIESVSFNQVQTPGFVFYDRQTHELEHVSTQQRVFATFHLDGIPPHTWSAWLHERITRETLRCHGNKPIVRVFYPAQSIDLWLPVRDSVMGLCLMFRDFAQAETLGPAASEVVSAPQTREDVLQLGRKLLEEQGDVVASDCATLLGCVGATKSRIHAIRESRFPKAVLRPNRK